MCSQMMALLRSLGLRHMQREPSGFWGNVKEDTHSIGSVTGVIMPWSTISCRSFSMAFLHSMGTFSKCVELGRRRGPGG